MLKDSIGTHGVSLSDLTKLTPTLKDIHAHFKAQHASDELAFMRLVDDTAAIKQVIATAQHIQKKFTTLIVVGIGGSDLGARAVISALRHSYGNELGKGMKIYFTGDTTDPTPLLELLDVVDLRSTALHVVSKSGNTIETMSAFMILREALIEKVGAKKHAAHVFVTTSATSGKLITLTQNEGYTLLPHGPVGGRFSVLSNVGLLPIACAGIDIKKIIAGAKDLRALLTTNTVLKNSAFIFAALHYLGYSKKNAHMSVLMPYEYTLKEFGAWYRQLWAESLGKDKKGQTPIAALGPTDQHSQLQLYQDGPHDKQITFIKALKRPNLKTPTVAIPGIEYFGNKQLSIILDAELEATALSLMMDKKANGTLIIPKVDAYYMGQLIYFFEMATAYSGELYGINAFDQPGVEQSKNFLHASLGNKDLQKKKEQIETLKKKIIPNIS
jgi:glucose-6-phosphate isomerase